MLSFSDINEFRLWLCQDLKNYLVYTSERDHHTPQPMQFHLCDWLQGTKPQWRNAIKVLQGFRGSAKTWLAVRRYAEWRLLRVPQTQVIIQSSTDRLAGGITASILDTLKHDPVFSHLTPAGRHGTLSFSLKGYKPEKGESITCAGIGTSMTGERAVLYIFDDPEPDTLPEASYDRIIAAFQEAQFILHPVDFLWPTGVVPIPEQTQMLVVGQPHWTGTAYFPKPENARRSDGEQGHPLTGATYLKIPALRKVPAGTPGSVTHVSEQYAELSMMPSRFSSKLLVDLRDSRKISPARWRLQMEIDTTPLEGEGSVLKLTKVKQVHLDLLTLNNLTLIVDPADGGECEWGLASGGTYENMVHVIDMDGFEGQILDEIEGLTPGEEVFERIFEYCNQMGIARVFIEKNYKAAVAAAKRAMLKMQVQAQVLTYSAAANKLHRIVNALDIPINSGMVTFEPHILKQRENYDQLAGLRYTMLPKPNDRIDALAGMLGVFIDMPNMAVDTKTVTVLHSGYAGDTRPATFAAIPKLNPFDRLRAI